MKAVLGGSVCSVNAIYSIKKLKSNFLSICLLHFCYIVIAFPICRETYRNISVSHSDGGSTTDGILRQKR